MQAPVVPNLQKPLTEHEKKLCCLALKHLNDAIVDGLKKGAEEPQSEAGAGAKSVVSSGFGLDEISVLNFILHPSKNSAPVMPSAHQPSTSQSNIAGAETSEFEVWARGALSFYYRLNATLLDYREPEISRDKVVQLLKVIQEGIGRCNDIKRGRKGKTRKRVKELLRNAERITNSVLTENEARAKEREEDRRALRQMRNIGLQLAVANRGLNPERAGFQNIGVSSEED